MVPRHGVLTQKKKGILQTSLTKRLYNQGFHQRNQTQVLWRHDAIHVSKRQILETEDVIQRPSSTWTIDTGFGPFLILCECTGAVGIRYRNKRSQGACWVEYCKPYRSGKIRVTHNEATVILRGFKRMVTLHTPVLLPCRYLIICGFLQERHLS